MEMILSPAPATAPPPPPPLPAVVAVEEAAVVVVVVVRGAGELVATDEEDTGKRSGRSSSISWLCVST